MMSNVGHRNHTFSVVKSTLHEGQPSKSEANTHKRLTHVKKEVSFVMAQRKQVEFSFWLNTYLFPWAMSSIVFSAFINNFTSLEYEFQGMALTPSCKGLGVGLLN